MSDKPQKESCLSALAMVAFIVAITCLFAWIDYSYWWANHPDAPAWGYFVHN